MNTAATDDCRRKCAEGGILAASRLQTPTFTGGTALVRNSVVHTAARAKARKSLIGVSNMSRELLNVRIPCSPEGNARPEGSGDSPGY